MEANRSRVRRSIAEKRRIVELTLEPGQSVARVAQAEGVNSHQVFQWRRLYRQGSLQEPGTTSTALLPVVVSDGCKNMAGREEVQETEPACSNSERVPSSTGAIHIELPGRALISVEGRADATVVRAVLEVLRG